MTYKEALFGGPLAFKSLPGQVGHRKAGTEKPDHNMCRLLFSPDEAAVFHMLTTQCCVATRPYIYVHIVVLFSILPAIFYFHPLEHVEVVDGMIIWSSFHANVNVNKIPRY